MFLSFLEYIKREKKSFQMRRYELDVQYKAVLFRQYGESYRWYCKSQQICDEYEKIAYDIHAYEKRIERYRNS